MTIKDLEEVQFPPKMEAELISENQVKGMSKEWLIQRMCSASRELNEFVVNACVCSIFKYRKVQSDAAYDTLDKRFGLYSD